MAPIKLPRRFRNLLVMSSNEQAAFGCRVARAQGTIRVFVHPYFEDYRPSPFLQRDPREFHRLNPKVKAIARYLETLAHNRNPGYPPLIIFEEEGHLLDTAKRLTPNGRTIYFVPTITDWGVPKTTPPGVTGEDPESYWETTDAWQRVIAPLKIAGVTHAIVGGMYLNVSREDRVLKPHNIRAWRTARRMQGVRNLEYDLKFCVSHVVKALLEHGLERVTVSSFTHPHSYRDIIAIEQALLAQA